MWNELGAKSCVLFLAGQRRRAGVTATPLKDGNQTGHLSLLRDQEEFQGELSALFDIRNLWNFIWGKVYVDIHMALYVSLDLKM